MAVIDHLVVAVPDLDDGIEWLAAATGVRPAFGGVHVGMGTHNALASFGSGYVELIATDPAQPDPAGGRPFGIDDVADRRLVAFAVRPEPGGTIDDVRSAALAGGYDPGDVVAMSRRTAQGGLLAWWRLTLPPTVWSGVELFGAVPFVIDWGDTPMPAATAPGGLRLAELTVGHPRPDVVGGAHAALGLDTGARSGYELLPADPAVLRARLTGPDGTVTI